MLNRAMSSLIKGIAEYKDSNLRQCHLCNHYYKRGRVGEHSLGIQICVFCYNNIKEAKGFEEGSKEEEDRGLFNERSSGNPFKVYSHLERRNIISFFNEKNFHSASKLAGILGQKVNNSGWSEVVGSFSSGLGFCDSFNFKKGLAKLKEARSLVDEHGLLLDYVKTLDALVDHYSVLRDFDLHDDRFPPCMLAELLNNARRCSEAGNYDSAMSRLYRALELILYLKFFELDLINKDGLNRGRFSVSLSQLCQKYEDVGEDYSVRFSDFVYGDRLRLNLRAQLVLLGRLEVPLAESMLRDKRLNSLLSLRDTFIVSYMMNAVCRKRYADLSERVRYYGSCLFSDLDDFCSRASYPALME